MVSPKFLADFSRENTTTLYKGGRQRFYVAHVRPGNVAKSIRIAIYALHKYTWASRYTKCLYFYVVQREKITLTATMDKMINKSRFLQWIIKINYKHDLIEK